MTGKASVPKLKVSVLFSEPKIPQSIRQRPPQQRPRRGFSALQRAENSSMMAYKLDPSLTKPFQCSSASRKFLNLAPDGDGLHVLLFQCSSASRKFLNSPGKRNNRNSVLCFSALQRAENSSIPLDRLWQRCAAYVSVLFSEPKIPQS